ncbi:TenA family protein [Parafrigoribacterium soli]|uniref:TenA family protein n=1 Tax=Parafrigoribacterium soli TaxID=3144663 RepID=UPI0032EC3966
MTFTDELWHESSAVLEAIDRLPFLVGLEDGRLPRDLFSYYMAQDAHYLASYGRVLASAAARSELADELLFWAGSATTAVSAERQLHAAYVADFSAIPASPTCTAYTSYLFSLAAGGCHPALVAGLLPCFWIYEDVGRRLKERVGDLSAHPYADWIATYGDPGFADATRQARGIVDRAAADAGPADRDRMRQAFGTGARFEWMFWDAAWRREEWPV